MNWADRSWLGSSPSGWRPGRGDTRSRTADSSTASSTRRTVGGPRSRARITGTAKRADSLDAVLVGPLPTQTAEHVVALSGGPVVGSI